MPPIGRSIHPWRIKVSQASTLKVCTVELCILNCFMLSSLPCFCIFCWSAIPTFRYSFVMAPEWYSAGGVGSSYMRACIHMWYMVCIIRNAHVRVMEAENSITLAIHSSVNVLIALGWHSENDYWFYLWICLPGPWIHSQDYEHYACTLYTFSLV